MALIVIAAREVRALLPMPRCIDLMADAMTAASLGTIRVPPRFNMPLVDGSGSLLLMPGSTVDPGVFGAKLVSLMSANPARGQPAVQGFVTLFDHDSGRPMAIIEGASITAIRTAAASGLATRLLAREDASSCGIYGTGVQAVSHIDAMSSVRSLKTVLVWGRDADRASAFAARQAERTGLDVRAVRDPAAVAACDIICTVTAAARPILQGEWVRTGTHVNLVGAHTLDAREADTALIARARVYVDLLESARNESGDLMIPVHEGALGADHIAGEIGELLSGAIAGRANPDQITLYKSLGITAQDIYAAHYVYRQALAKGAGTEVTF